MTQPTSTRHRARLAGKMALLSVGLATVGVLATSGVSLAHQSAAEATCDHIHVKVIQFVGPASNNSVTVTVDGVNLPTVFFANEYEETIPLVETVAHTWHVHVEADISKGGNSPFNYDNGGTVGPCTDTSSTTTTSTTSTSTSTTTTAPGVTTTTLRPTTTTAGATTTTVGATTTTISGSGGPTPSTTTTLAPGTTTTVRAATTTTAVASEAPTGSASSGGKAPSSGALPVTGSDTGAQLTLAMAVLLAGAGLVTITRRRAHGATDEN